MNEIREDLRPASIAEAVDAKSRRGDAARYLAGGTDLLVIKPPELRTVIDIMNSPWTAWSRRTVQSRSGRPR